MKKFKRKISGLFICLALTLPIFIPATYAFADENTEEATTKQPEENVIDAKAAIAVDAKTGKIFYAQNADEVLGIASMTKLLSIYLVLDAIKEEKIKWQDTVSIPDYLYPLSQNMELSNVPLYPENTYTVKDLYEASLIVSANAAVIALANYVAGDEAKFVSLMKEKLASLNIEDAKIVNSSGLTNVYLGENRVLGTELDDENYMSAKDMAKMTRQLLLDHPEILETTKLAKKEFGEKLAEPLQMESWNWMLPGLSNETAGVDGLKTGTTDLAGACFVGTREKDGQRVITVVMHANQHDQDPKARFVETAKLLNEVDNHWRLEMITPQDVTFTPNELPVTRGMEKIMPLTLKETSAREIWVKDQEKPTFKVAINENLLQDGSLVAPIHQGIEVGKIEMVSKDTLGFLTDDEKKEEAFTLVTKKDIKRGTFMMQIKDIFNELKDKTMALYHRFFK